MLFKLRQNKKNSKKESLLLDSDGCCLFHSNDEHFRRKHRGTEQFKWLLEAVMIYDRLQEKQGIGLNLSELKIDSMAINKNRPSVCDAGKVEYEIEAFQICKLDLYFDYTSFYNKLIFRCCEFSMISFANSSFKGEVTFADTTFEQCNFHRANFYDYITFEEVTFNQFVDFSHSVFWSGIDVLEVTFIQEVVFAHTKFKENKNKTALSKFQAEFKRFTDFSECVFETFLILSYCVFEGEVNFTNTIFRSRFFVQKSIIQANFFIKKDTLEEPVFQDLVDFDVDPEEVTGKVIFENVSFHKINADHRQNLLQMVQDNKVEIGSGCIKYRLQTPNKHINLEQDKQVIVVEFTQSFVNYFLRSSGLNLGLEIKERTKKHITYFLYSDENISEKEFFQRLARQERNFLELLFPFDLTQKHKTTRKFNDVLNKIDGFAALLSTCIKIGVRISIGEWHKRDTAQLAHAISFQQHQDIDSGALHDLIATRFNQDRIVNNFFIKESVGVKFEQTKFIGGSHQFSDEINNYQQIVHRDESNTDNMPK